MEKASVIAQWNEVKYWTAYEEMAFHCATLKIGTIMVHNIKPFNGEVYLWASSAMVEQIEI